jgi:hypothetical protein
MAKRYCPMCDKWVPATQRECKACGADTERVAAPEPQPVVDLMAALRTAWDRAYAPATKVKE